MGTVLLVDDNLLTVDVLALILRAQAPGCSVLKAADGKQAVDFLKVSPVTVVLTDLRMPVLDGYGVIRYRNECCPGLPVVVITCDLNPDVLLRLQRLGVTECFEKPIDYLAVVNRLITHLSRDQSPACRPPLIAAPVKASTDESRRNPRTIP